MSRTKPITKNAPYTSADPGDVVELPESVGEPVDIVTDQGWISGAVFALMLSVIFVAYVSITYVVCVFALILIIASLILEKQTVVEVNLSNVYNLRILTAWYIYGLLPWNLTIPWVISMVTQLATVGLSVGYVFFEHPVLQIAQAVLLFVPINLLGKAEAMQINMTVFFFCLASFAVVMIDSILKRTTEWEYMVMLLLPLLRTSDILIILYGGAVISMKVVQLYLKLKPNAHAETPSGGKPNNKVNKIEVQEEDSSSSVTVEASPPPAEIPPPPPVVVPVPPPQIVIQQQPPPKRRGGHPLTRSAYSHSLVSKPQIVPIARTEDSASGSEFSFTPIYGISST